ncbi:MAG TPA: hypothetical protein VLJ59_09060 [Mycobacteriales bacterium]|nr:hypothetical protein [Mycobacteriales bacterium]
MSAAPGWRQAPLASLVRDGEISYGIVQPGYHVDAGIPIVRVGDIRSGVISVVAPLRVEPSVAARYARTSLRGGEVLVSLVGTVGESAVVPDQLAGWNVARAVAVLRPEGVSAAWIRLCLQTSAVRHQVSGLLNTTVQATLNLADLKRLSLPVAPDREMVAIAEVLGVLDDKIAANAKLANTADELAAVKFKMLGSSDAAPGQLGDILVLEYGKALPSSLRLPGQVDVYGSSGVVGSHNVALCCGRGVVVGRKGTVGAVHWASGPHFPIDTTFYVTPRTDRCTDIFCYFVLKSLRLAEMNSDSAVPGLNRSEAHAIPISIPGKVAIERFSERAYRLFEAKTQTEQESRTLAAVRDALLPQLMSGRLRVKDAEALVEDAV